MFSANQAFHSWLFIDKDKHVYLWENRIFLASKEYRMYVRSTYVWLFALRTHVNTEQMISLRMLSYGKLRLFPYVFNLDSWKALGFRMSWKNKEQYSNIRNFIINYKIHYVLYFSPFPLSHNPAIWLVIWFLFINACTHSISVTFAFFHNYLSVIFLFYCTPNGLLSHIKTNSLPNR